jgi:putative Ig domain-containing protein
LLGQDSNAEVPQKIRFEDGVIVTLAFPRSKAVRAFSVPQVSFLFLLLSLGVLVFATGCASLNAGSGTSIVGKPSQTIAISAHLPPAMIGSAYNAVISVNGGSAPYNFAIRSGRLPQGLTLNPQSGSISGRPLNAGAFSFMVSVADKSRAAEGLRQFAIMVAGAPATKPTVQVAVSPTSFTLAPGASHQFLAQVSNASSTAVSWSASAGTVTASGVFTAPNSTALPATVQLVATSKADPSQRAIASVTITAPTSTANLAITSAAVPEATEGTPYTTAVRVSGGTAPYHWKIASGALPSGLALDEKTGGINGITSQTGPFPFAVAAGDASGKSVSRSFTMSVLAANAGNLDGPAELPRAYVNSSLKDTPAPGATHPVSTKAALQTALDSAKCGDTISLQAGSTFDGVVTLPAKDCDDAHWIVIRTSSPDSALPAEGTRITPCYAGVATLPGRPSYPCPNARNVLAKVMFSGTGSGPIVLADGANHYRLVGLEITRSLSKNVVYNLVISEKGGTAHHIVIDRSWIHGTAHDETTRGVMLTGTTNFAVVDSFLNDFHCVASTGSCVDSQAIAGGLGNTTMGPYKFVNNFLEAAGENIIFGGGAATRTPEDIEVRRNHFYKPLMWKKGQPGFVGGRDGNPFIVKNLFELKNGARVLFEGNVLENSWGGFSQAGFGILLTPKNQNGLCPLCVVHDITVRYSTISHVGNGFQIANHATPSGAITLGMWNVSIHDVVLDDVDGPTYGGGGHLFQQSNTNPQSILHHVTINHVTAMGKNPKSAMMVIGNMKAYPEMYGFVWANNIFTSGSGITTTGGGAINCAYKLQSAGIITGCFKDSDFSHNAIISADGKWPLENYAPASSTDVKFVSSTAIPLSRYQLQSSSPYSHAAADGKDIGADVQALAAAIAGVQ